uniref:Uncharacterized protein n=1 Tax=Sciurus vulgaris TaxID=55149 RepID=A0A8D2JL76_SCIVU
MGSGRKLCPQSVAMGPGLQPKTLPKEELIKFAKKPMTALQKAKSRCTRRQ